MEVLYNQTILYQDDYEPPGYVSTFAATYAPTHL
jgi:hypothetical protein